MWHTANIPKYKAGTVMLFLLLPKSLFVTFVFTFVSFVVKSKSFNHKVQKVHSRRTKEETINFASNY